MDIEQLYSNVGKPVRYCPDPREDGYLYRAMAYKVVGIQLDFAGRPAYRVECTEYEDTFGRVMFPAEAVFA